MMIIDAWSRCFVELLSRLDWLTHNIAPHISLHDPPYHKTMKKNEDFEGVAVFSVPPAEIRDSNMVL